MVHITEVVE